jgi:hypothetical protein
MNGSAVLWCFIVHALLIRGFLVGIVVGILIWKWVEMGGNGVPFIQKSMHCDLQFDSIIWKKLLIYLIHIEVTFLLLLLLLLFFFFLSLSLSFLIFFLSEQNYIKHFCLVTYDLSSSSYFVQPAGENYANPKTCFFHVLFKVTKFFFSSLCYSLFCSNNHVGGDKYIRSLQVRPWYKILGHHVNPKSLSLLTKA